MGFKCCDQQVIFLFPLPCSDQWPCAHSSNSTPFSFLICETFSLPCVRALISIHFPCVFFHVLAIPHVPKLGDGYFLSAHVEIRAFATQTECARCHCILTVHHFNDVLLRQHGFDICIADGLVSVHGHSCCCAIQRSERCLELIPRLICAVRKHLPIVCTPVPQLMCSADAPSQRPPQQPL